MSAREETFYEELKRYVLFDAEDQQALTSLAPLVTTHARAIAEEFYQRISAHDGAQRVLTGPTQLERLKTTLATWVVSLLAGPWDEAYYVRHARIGKAHLAVGLPQHYLVLALNVVRLALFDLAHHERAAVRAITKVVDVELTILLETYREADVERLRRTCRDERALLELELALSEARYDEIVERGQTLVVTTERDGRIVLFNSRCQVLTGIDRARAAGLLWDEVFPPGGDEGRDLARARIEALAGKVVAPVTAPFISVGGATHWVRWQLTTIPGLRAPLLCAIGIDTTEERALTASNRRSERLASLGTMAAGLAHEIRNPLNAASLQLTLVGRRLATFPDPTVVSAREAATLAAAELRRLGALVNEFLSFARPQPLRLERLDLRAVAEAALALLGLEARASGAELTLSPGPPVIAEADSDRLMQVLMNLIHNAMEAAGHGGHVDITLQGGASGAIIEVLDDGPGFPDDAPIFEPFFTTKQGGTGLGLAIVHRIAADHGGRVEAERRSGWTIFRVTLPRGA